MNDFDRPSEPKQAAPLEDAGGDAGATPGFSCYICGEGSTEICPRCTRDTCANHICERCSHCSDCCVCDEPHR